jgi:hypothetical protein
VPSTAGDSNQDENSTAAGTDSRGQAVPGTAGGGQAVVLGTVGGGQEAPPGTAGEEAVACNGKEAVENVGPWHQQSKPDADADVPTPQAQTAFQVANLLGFIGLVVPSSKLDGCGGITIDCVISLGEGCPGGYIILFDSVRWQR